MSGGTVMPVFALSSPTSCATAAWPSGVLPSFASTVGSGTASGYRPGIMSYGPGPAPAMSFAPSAVTPLNASEPAGPAAGVAPGDAAGAFAGRVRAVFWGLGVAAGFGAFGPVERTVMGATRLSRRWKRRQARAFSPGGNVRRPAPGRQRFGELERLRLQLLAQRLEPCAIFRDPREVRAEVLLRDAAAPVVDVGARAVERDRFAPRVLS